jgi:hypothetical protein
MPQGGSTITQQLVRAVLLRGLRSREAGSQLLYDSLVDRTLARAIGVPATNKLRRKAEEIRLSYWLEAELERSLGSRAQAKLEILRRYATYVYLGQGRYGFAAASELYLGRPLASLCRAGRGAAALLAGPAQESRRVRADRAQRRARAAAPRPRAPADGAQRVHHGGGARAVRRAAGARGGRAAAAAAADRHGERDRHALRRARDARRPARGDGSAL